MDERAEHVWRANRLRSSCADAPAARPLVAVAGGALSALGIEAVVVPAGEFFRTRDAG